MPFPSIRGGCSLDVFLLVLCVLIPLAFLLDCLQRKGYDESKCKDAVLALYKCCEAFYREKGSDAVSLSCPKKEVLGRQMENLTKH